MSLPPYVRKGVVVAAQGQFDDVTLGDDITVTGTGTFADVVTTGINTESVATGIVASATQTRVGGTALTKAINVVATSATSGNAVTLPALAVGQSVLVFNAGANPISVFPNGASDTVDGGSGGASVPLANAKRCIYICVAANTIISAQLGVVSA